VTINVWQHKTQRINECSPRISVANPQPEATVIRASRATGTIVTMAALFTAIVRSPLTGVVLLLEMTGAWSLVLPMMAASLTAYAVPELLRNPPIYESLRQRDEQIERRERKMGEYNRRCAAPRLLPSPLGSPGRGLG